MLRKRAGLITLFSFTAVLSLVAALGAVTSYIFENEVLPQTMVAGVSIGGMSYPAAQTIISQKATELEALNITFKLNDKSANTTIQELGVTVDSQSAVAEIIQPDNAFKWLSPRYWRSVFSQKTVGFSYVADQAILRKNVEKNLNISTAAKDAQIRYDAGKLVIEEGQAGLSVSSDAIDQAIRTTLAKGEPVQATLDFTEQSPNITTAMAATTISQVESSLIPISLQFESQQFSVTPASQYSFLDFAAENGQLKWQVSESKIKNYLSSTVAKKVNIVMLPRTTQFDTKQVTQEGRDGRETDTAKLARDIARTITEHTDTSNAPITISTKPIAFTEKTVYPQYVAGLWPSLYIDINLTAQRLFVMVGETKQAEYMISSGKRGTPTPSGVFYIKNKIPLAQSRLFPGIWMEKWNALARTPDGGGYQGYGLHRVPCFDSQCNSREPSSHLGRPVSHGCVRIEDAGADWVYDNAPVGTPVNIHP